MSRGCDRVRWKAGRLTKSCLNVPLRICTSLSQLEEARIRTAKDFVASSTFVRIAIIGESAAPG